MGFGANVKRRVKNWPLVLVDWGRIGQVRVLKRNGTAGNRERGFCVGRCVADVIVFVVAEEDDFVEGEGGIVVVVNDGL